MERLEQLNIEVMGEWTEVKQEVRAAMKRFFKKTIERRPVILPVILEM
jgi:ribonuclease J